MIQDEPDAAIHALGLRQEIKLPMTLCAFLIGRDGYVGWDC